MKKLLLLLITAVIIGFSAAAQDHVDRALVQGKSLYAQGLYIEAIGLFDLVRQYGNTNQKAVADDYYIKCIEGARQQRADLQTALKQAQIEKQRADSSLTVAQIEKQRADSLTLSAQSMALTATALQIQDKAPTKAIRLAELAWKIAPIHPPAPNTQITLSDIFYNSYKKPFYLNSLQHNDRVSFAEFSPDGNKVVTASDDNTAKIWDANTGNLIATLTGHTSTVNSAQFSPDGNKIVTASWDNTAKIWITPEGIMDTLETMPIYKLQHKDFQSLGIDFLTIKTIDDIINYNQELATDFYELDLSNLWLNNLPKEITRFPNLQFLNLTNNNLTELPIEIKQLTQLKTLTLTGNNFSDTEKQKIESWFQGSGCELVW